MKETKVYIDELPKSCIGCKYFAEHRRQCELKLGFQWSEEKQKYNDCPLKSLHDHDKELARQIFDKIIHLASLQNNDNLYIATVCIIEEVKKEFEDGE